MWVKIYHFSADGLRFERKYVATTEYAANRKILDAKNVIFVASLTSGGVL